LYRDVGTADQQKKSGNKIGRWGCIQNSFMLSPLPCFPSLFSSVIPISHHIFSLVYATLLATGAHLSWSLLSITERQVCPHRLPQWTMQYGWRITDLASVQRLCFVAKCFMHMCTSEENGIANEAIVLQRRVWSALWDFKVVKKQWAGALLSVKCGCYESVDCSIRME